MQDAENSGRFKLPELKVIVKMLSLWFLRRRGITISAALRRFPPCTAPRSS